MTRLTEMPHAQFKCIVGMAKPVVQEMSGILQVAYNTNINWAANRLIVHFYSVYTLMRVIGMLGLDKYLY